MNDLEDLADRLDAARLAQPRDAAVCAAVLEEAIGAFDADPAGAGEVFVLGELYDELWPEYESLGRIEDALAAADAVASAGLEMEPDPRCLRAEILLRAGRVTEAEPIWAAVRRDTPGDVWLYNNAGLEYAAAGDNETALEWLTAGLSLAIESRDPERLVDQLADLRRASLVALGRGEDELQQRAAAFLEQSRRPDPARRRGLPSAWLAVEAAGAAGWDTVAESAEPQSASQVAWAWFPAGEYERALAAWPDLAEGGLAGGPGGVRSHARYCQQMQRRLGEAAAAGLTRTLIAPLIIAEFTAWCREHGEEPRTADARAAYAADLARRGDPSLIAWPPSRNQRCWCGSGVKYKKCCGAPR